MVKKVSRPWLSGSDRSKRMMSKGNSLEPLQPGGEQFHVAQFERSVPAVAQQVAHDPHVVRIILDQEDVDALAFGLGTAWFHRRISYSTTGNSTSSNQYLLNVPSRSTRPRNVAGLVM